MPIRVRAPRGRNYTPSERAIIYCAAMAGLNLEEARVLVRAVSTRELNEATYAENLSLAQQYRDEPDFLRLCISRPPPRNMRP